MWIKCQNGLPYTTVLTLVAFLITAQITLDQFPRNFPAADVTRKSPASYGRVVD